MGSVRPSTPVGHCLSLKMFRVTHVELHNIKGFHSLLSESCVYDTVT